MPSCIPHGEGIRLATVGALSMTLVDYAHDFSRPAVACRSMSAAVESRPPGESGSQPVRIHRQSRF
jgi:hypothetical protein